MKPKKVFLEVGSLYLQAISIFFVLEAHMEKIVTDWKISYSGMELFKFEWMENNAKHFNVIIQPFGWHRNYGISLRLVEESDKNIVARTGEKYIFKEGYIKAPFNIMDNTQCFAFKIKKVRSKNIVELRLVPKYMDNIDGTDYKNIIRITELGDSIEYINKNYGTLVTAGRC